VAIREWQAGQLRRAHAFPASGKILFQSEGAEVFFRSIEVYPLK
jgi:hypothetical protein